MKNDLEVANIELKQKLQRMKMDRDALQVKLANIVQGCYLCVNLAYQSSVHINRMPINEPFLYVFQPLTSS